MKLSIDIFSKRSGSTLEAQCGQAIAEALLVLAVLIACFTAVIWLGQVANLGIQASMASRYQAFQLTRSANGGSDNAGNSDLSNFNLKERGLNGLKVLEQGAVTVSHSSQTQMSDEGRIGTQNTQAARLREEWNMDDGRVQRAMVTVKPFTSANSITAEQPVSGKPAAGFEVGGNSTRTFLNSVSLTMKRQTSILTSAGHSADDLAANKRAASADTAWKSAADDSIHLTKSINARIRGIDRGWNRPEPTYDWIINWHQLIPVHHLNTFKE